ncbi:hypothetical protein IKF89_01510 [Candidatus Saccharibacteria bacterium]|nr:hypothetical protein [Candidatus Saccharibacteria bacterium]
MSDLTSLGILLLSMLIMAFLQLVPGIFVLFSHYKFGQFFKLKASDLTVFFILGAETSVVMFFLAIYAIFYASPLISLAVDSDIFAWIMAGILIAISLLFFCLYYRRGKTSELFISRNFAAHCRTRIKTAKTRSEAFLLGFFAGIPELIFTLPLYVLAVTSVVHLGTNGFERAGLIILFALVAIAPLLIFYSLTSAGRTLADFARFRFKNKSFFRFIIPLLYFLIAVLIILGVLL